MDAFLRWLLRGFIHLGRLFQHGGAHYFNVLYGFIGSRAMMTCQDIGLFDAISDQPKSAAQLMDELGLDPDGARILLDACVNQNLIVDRNGRYGLRRSFRRWLAQDGVREDILHTQLLYDDTMQLRRCVRGDWPGDAKVRLFWGGNYQTPSAEESAVYTDYMQATVSRSARHVAKAFPFGQIESLLDVGGSSGTLATTLALANPKLRVGILDLAAVEQKAIERIEAAGLSDRVEFIPGNFLEMPLPTGWLTMLLHRVLWDWPDEPALILLGRILTALPSGGRLLVTEGMWSGDEQADRLLCSFHLYMCLGGFRLRSRDEVMALLRQAGFVEVHAVRVLPIFMPMVIGTKPASPRPRAGAGAGAE